MNAGGPVKVERANDKKVFIQLDRNYQRYKKYVLRKRVLETKEQRACKKL
jgi:hypothetical protein